MKINETIIQAVIDNQAQQVIELLDQGADPNSFENANEKITLLHLAALYGADKVIEPLIRAGADIDARTANNGVTPLEIAKQHRFKQTMSILEQMRQDELQASLLD